MMARARVHRLVGADELEAGEAREAWHDFADLMGDAIDSMPDLDEADRIALARTMQLAIAELRRVGARVVAGEAGRILFVAVLPVGYSRDPRMLFARA